MTISGNPGPRKLHKLEEAHTRRFDVMRRTGDAWMQHLQDNPLRPSDPADVAAFTVIAGKALTAYRLALTHYSLAAQCREAQA